MLLAHQKFQCLSRKHNLKALADLNYLIPTYLISHYYLPQSQVQLVPYSSPIATAFPICPAHSASFAANAHPTFFCSWRNSGLKGPFR